jgi:alkylated DNA repair protein alkB family protein 1
LHTELTPDQPIVSISIGNSAVFLLGETERTQPPLAMFLRSGDVLVMGGPMRMAYHAVPR